MATKRSLSKGEQAPAVASTAEDPAEARELRLARYSDVVERAQLSSVRLTSVHFEVSPDYFAPRNRRKNAKQLLLEVVPDTVVFDSESGYAGVFLSCEAAARVKDAEILSCKATYIVAYGNLIGCDEEASKAFLYRVGQFACYPYFRALFSTMDGMAGTEMPVLPVLKEPPRKAPKD